MSHLTEAEFIDMLEGSLPRERARHAEQCGLCRTQIEHLREALSFGDGASLPEPSPLFWEQFARRVQHDIGSAGIGRSRWFAALTPLRGLTAAGAIAALVLVAVLSRGTDGDGNRVTGGTAVATIDPLLEPDAPGADEGWAAVRAAAENVAWDDAQEAGLAAQPGTADRAIGSLTDAERERLLTLLAEDLKKTGE
jgi:hypothetical protein